MDIVLPQNLVFQATTSSGNSSSTGILGLGFLIVCVAGGMLVLMLIGSSSGGSQQSTRTEADPVSTVRGYEELTNDVQEKLHGIVQEIEHQGNFRRIVIDNRIEFKDNDGRKHSEIEIYEGGIKPKYRSSEGVMVEFLSTASIDAISAYEGEEAYRKMIAEDIEAKIG